MRIHAVVAKEFNAESLVVRAAIVDALSALGSGPRDRMLEHIDRTLKGIR